MNRNYIISISFILIAFGGARDQYRNAINVLPASIQKSYNPNIIQIKILGDTARLEIEKNGNVYVRHYIDLKGKENGGFDNSYTVTCVYTNFPSDIKLNSNFRLSIDSYWVYFDKRSINKICDSVLHSNAEAFLKAYYKRAKLCVQQRQITNNFGWEVMLMQLFKHKIVNRKTGEIQKLLLVESYTTEFSGGKNFYVVSQNDDTTALFHLNEYMR